MKLRNKKTGDIYELNEFCLYDDKGFSKRPFLKSLAELNEEWEDYEEPTTFWAISWAGEPEETPQELKDMAKEIGNYFETKEEAEKAVEKLKAFNRLKDKGFRFDGYDVAHKSNGNLAGQIFYDAGYYSIADVEKEMDLLFGGEDEK